jgi:hypothetical protein
MFAIRCIRLAVAFSTALVLTSTAVAQCGRGYSGSGAFVMAPAGYGGYSLAALHRSARANRAAMQALSRSQSRAKMLANAKLSSSSTTGEASYESMYGAGQPATSMELERQRIMQLAQQRRDEEKSRREKSRDAIPVRTWSEEQLAQSRFKVAHMLYLEGEIDAAKKVLGKLLDEFPDTATADRAKLTLAQL